MLAFCRLPQSVTRMLPALALALAFACGTVAAQTPAAASASGVPGSITVGTASITYFARSGDTLISIARQYTEKAGNWIALGKLNRIERDSAIPIGTPILIPGELLNDSPAQATVVAMTGDIAATAPDGSRSRLAIGATVAEGTRIQTGGNSFLTLSLVDQSRISVPSNTRVELARLRITRYLRSPRTQVLLLGGRVESRVAPLQATRGRYEVHTPLSVAGVRGTHFRVGYVGNAATARIATETLAGKVAVATASRAGAPDTLVLASGQGNITDAAAIGPAIGLLAAPRLAPATAGNPAEFPQSAITLQGIAGAHAYHLQIATDPEAVNLIAEASARSPTLAIDGVADGDYYARLSAIDRFGLEGLERIEPISLRARQNRAATGVDPRADAAVMPGAPSVAGSDERSLTLRWTPVAGLAMRLQLARDSDFSYLLANRVSRSGEARLPRPAFGTYYARVELLDAAGNVLASSMAQPVIVTDQWIINDGNPVAVRQGRAASTR